MTTAERTRIAFERGTPDRVPIHCWLALRSRRLIEVICETARELRRYN